MIDDGCRRESAGAQAADEESGSGALRCGVGVDGDAEGPRVVEARTEPVRIRWWRNSLLEGTLRL